MGFWGSMFGGSNPTINSGINQAGQTSSWANSTGQNLTNQGVGFLSGLLSGDPAKTAKLLAPQISGITKRGQQEKQTMAQFGNRSGGTNAAAQNIDDTSRANVSSMISQLTGSALSGALQTGQSLVDTGMQALNQKVNFSQQQMENWSNSIFGQGLTSGAGFAMKAGLNAIPGMG